MSNIASQRTTTAQRHYLYAVAAFLFAAVVQIVFLSNSSIPFLPFEVGLNPYALPLVFEELFLLAFLILVESYVFWRAGLLSIAGFPFSPVVLAVTLADCPAHIVKSVFQAAFMEKFLLFGPELPAPESGQFMFSLTLLILAVIAFKAVGYIIPLRKYGVGNIVRIGIGVNIIILTGIFILGSASGHLFNWLLI
jgi:hypothetical protein